VKGATHFLNVDLEIYSRSDLQPLVAAFGKEVFVLYAGRVKRTYQARLELARMTKTADATIRDFYALIKTLPKTAREMWDAAKVRDFSIGVQSCTKSPAIDFALATETLKAAYDLGARIVLTVYSPEVPQKLKRSRQMS
jgi:hypothetical protein